MRTPATWATKTVNPAATKKVPALGPDCTCGAPLNWLYEHRSWHAQRPQSARLQGEISTPNGVKTHKGQVGEWLKPVDC